MRIDFTKLSPNRTQLRSHDIDRITIHGTAGQISVESLGEWFAKSSTKASSNLAIGSDGRRGLYVPMTSRSWCSSSTANDDRAVTIECSSDATYPNALTDTVYSALIDLLVELCAELRRPKLVWIRDKKTALSYPPASDELLLTVHRWFAATECPGEWLMCRMGEIAETVTRRLAAPTVYRVQVGAFTDLRNAQRLRDQLHELGFPEAFII